MLAEKFAMLAEKFDRLEERRPPCFMLGSLFFNFLTLMR